MCQCHKVWQTNRICSKSLGSNGCCKELHVSCTQRPWCCAWNNLLSKLQSITVGNAAGELVGWHQIKLKSLLNKIKFSWSQIEAQWEENFLELSILLKDGNFVKLSILCQKPCQKKRIYRRALFVYSIYQWIIVGSLSLSLALSRDAATKLMATNTCTYVFRSTERQILFCVSPPWLKRVGKYSVPALPGKKSMPQNQVDWWTQGLELLMGWNMWVLLLWGKKQTCMKRHLVMRMTRTHVNMPPVAAVCRMFSPN